MVLFGRLRYALLDRALERGLLPDRVLRAGSRLGARRRLAREERGGVEARRSALRALVATMRTGPIAEAVGERERAALRASGGVLRAVPRPADEVLVRAGGATGVDDLAAAEEAMLALTCERAGIEDGMSVLDLGCGWGSLSLWLCERYPNAAVVAVSNSRAQREWIEAIARPARLRRASRGPHRRRQRARARSGASTASCRSRCSSTCATGRRCWRGSPAGSSPTGACSCTSSRTAASRTSSRARGRRSASSPPGGCRRTTCCCASSATSRSARAGRSPARHYARTLGAWLARLDANARARARRPRRRRAASAAPRGHSPAGGCSCSRPSRCGAARGGQEWMVSHHLLAPRGRWLSDAHAPVRVPCAWSAGSELGGCGVTVRRADGAGHGRLAWDRARDGAARSPR